jgi:replicative DNA helicase
MNIQHPYDLLVKHWDTILERNGKPPELPLKCFPHLNNQLWGLSRKKLVVVGARVSNGKSVFLLQTAWDLAQQGFKVVFFSFEMALTTCMDRLISMDLEIDNFLIRTGKIQREVNRPDFNDKFMDFTNRLNNSTLAMVESVGNTLPEFSEILNSFKGKGDIGWKPDVVVIDYGNLVKTLPKQSRKEAYDDYIKGLRSLAIKENFCAIMGSQINRSIYKDGVMRKPQLADLKDTGELEQVADLVFLLHWEHHHDAEKPRTLYKINIAKNRDGKTGERECTFIPEWGKIIDEPPREENGRY